MLTINAECTGPVVKVLTPELDFGRVDVLKNFTMNLSLNNASDIPAEYKAFTKSRNSVFKVPEKAGVFAPGEVRDIQVLCNADEV